ncbi:MAG TPA: pentapeptide repeat-containing protein [Labilithrix sp.]
MKPELEDAIWERLTRGRPLDDLGLSHVDGRVDVRGIRAPRPSLLRTHEVAGLRIREEHGHAVVRNVTWRGIDFSDSELNRMRFFDSKIEGCRFRDAECKDWRLWGTSLDGVDFTRADLRRSVHHASEMIECDFANAKISHVDFQGTVFVRCRFKGLLEDVLFYRNAFRGERFPPNEMLDVDLRETELRFVEFRSLDMASVRWPSGPGYILLDDYAATLDHLVLALEKREDAGARSVAAILRMQRKWAGTGQKRGLISLWDIAEAGGDALVEEIRLLLHA